MPPEAGGLLPSATRATSKSSRKAATFTDWRSSEGKLRARFLPQCSINPPLLNGRWPKRRRIREGMTKAIITTALALSLAATPAAAQANIEGHWTNPKHTTLVRVARCDGGSYCAVV